MGVPPFPGHGPREDPEGRETPTEKAVPEHSKMLRVMGMYESGGGVCQWPCSLGWSHIQSLFYMNQDSLVGMASQSFFFSGCTMGFF